MRDQLHANRAVLREIRGEIGLLKKLASYIPLLPLLRVERSYIGPGIWEIYPFNVENPGQYEYRGRGHPAANMERIVLAKNEAFVRIRIYLGRREIKVFDYNLQKEDKDWQVRDKKLREKSQSNSNPR
ncbi:MAG: hypothetical protein Q8Q31_04725 [Nanoarchaeota archaeon]|nr:hypothetical protein [Nanoarchaeota archaeon]